LLSFLFSVWLIPFLSCFLLLFNRSCYLWSDWWPSRIRSEPTFSLAPLLFLSFFFNCVFSCAVP
jgi:hypothetical protein